MWVAYAAKAINVFENALATTVNEFVVIYIMANYEQM